MAMEKEIAPEAGVVESLAALQIDWQLSSEQLGKLLHVSTEELSEGLAQARANPSGPLPRALRQAPALITIHRKIRLHYPESQDQVRWLTRPNSTFEGNTPWDLACDSPESLAWMGYVLAATPGPTESKETPTDSRD
jgi:hypothetical protein